TSYMGNYGGLDFLTDANAGLEGIFVYQLGPPYTTVSLLSITDGTSNTILFGERYNYDPNWNAYTSLGLPNAPMYTFGSFWVGGTLFLPLGKASYPLTYLLPPSPNSGDFLPLFYRLYAYGSGHTQGANFAFCDGSVRFISNAINNAPMVMSDAPTNGPAPIPLLGALCTRAGGEVVDASQY